MPKKSNSEQNTQSFIQAARRQIIHSAIFAVAALGVIVFACYAWFANNKSVSGTIGSIQMLGSLYELAGNGRGKTDNGYGVFYDNTKTGFGFNVLPAGDFSAGEEWPNLEATGTSQAIRWRLNDNSQIGNFGGSTGIRPGSSGMLQFYVIPNATGTLSLRFRLELKPLNDDGSANTTETLNKLLKGHLLFYILDAEGTKIWVSWDGDTSRPLQFNVPAETNVGVPQLVTLHWQWTAELSELIKDTTLNGKIHENRELLFYSESGSIPEADNIKAAIDENQITELTKLYNRADRYIGSQLTWLEVKLTAQPAS
jgi:hypothetical protein